MTQQEIDRAVCVATGECLCEVQQRGFSIADPLDVNFDPEPDFLPPSIVDWDEIELNRNVAVINQPRKANYRLV
ncbi:MAG: hypothetical protein HUJ26_07195 [Planctomycetaceae bacterium]|nr:hypothetical protein [Planctomycetaceae bacterium]